MPKYIKSSRSSSGRSNSNSLRDDLLRELEKEGEKILKKMTTQFARDLEQEGSRVLQNLFGSDTGATGASAAGTAASGISPGIETMTRLVGSLVSYAVASKPKTTTQTSETDRSRNQAQQFRVSHSQAMLEASAELGKSERNL